MPKTKKMKNKKTKSVKKITPVVELEERHDGMLLLPKKRDLRIVYILFGILVMLDVTFIVCYVAYSYVITRPIEIGGTIECNSGNIGVDYQSIYNNTRVKANITLLDETYNFNQVVGWTPKAFNLKGIDGLNCKVQVNSKAHISDLIYLMKEVNKENER